jgi:hypothetical protein
MARGEVKLGEMASTGFPHNLVTAAADLSPVGGGDARRRV